MKVLSPNEAEIILKQEYPKLKFIITKQFSSQGTQPRTYNTFLLKLEDKKSIIAKSYMTNSRTLELEWHILKQLNRENKNAPKLIYPNIKPKTFLLMEFIDAKDASIILKQDPNNLGIFKLIGECLGKLHTTKASWFGNPVEQEKYYDNWEGLMKDKVDNRVKGLNNILDIHEYEKIKYFYSKIRESFLNDDVTQPILIHRDIYVENFLIDSNDKITLIDYGMAYGGRPWYDLGKFYVIDLYENPKAKELFLKEYGNYITIPNNFNELTTYYIFAELTGSLLSYRQYGHEISYKRAHNLLMGLVTEKSTKP